MDQYKLALIHQAHNPRGSLQSYNTHGNHVLHSGLELMITILTCRQSCQLGRIWSRLPLPSASLPVIVALQHAPPHSWPHTVPWMP
eukprot:1068684-Pelagomonas_calceolata.AAC.5